MHIFSGRVKATNLSGFTLIEILVVVVILSIVISTVLFSVDVTGFQKSRTFVKETRFLMRNLADEAILSGLAHGLQWQPVSRQMKPMVYRDGLWREVPKLDPVSWRGLAKVTLLINGLEIEQNKEEDQVSDSKAAENSSTNPPTILFWSTGLWDPAGRIKIEIDSLPYADIVWTMGGRITTKYPDEDF